MSVKASVRHVGDVAVVDLSGRFTLGEGSGLIRNTVKGLLKEGRLLILLNLADVSYVDSAALGEMVGAFASVSNAGGKIKLLNAQGRVSEVLVVTKLYTVFESFSDEAAALRSFSGVASA
jgi:anti-sigma B factor antagonist